MITTASLVMLIAAIGALIINWRAYKSDVTSAGWGGNRQLAMAAVWVVIITTVTLAIRYFSA